MLEVPESMLPMLRGFVRMGMPDALSLIRCVRGARSCSHIVSMLSSCACECGLRSVWGNRSLPSTRSGVGRSIPFPQGSTG